MIVVKVLGMILLLCYIMASIMYGLIKRRMGVTLSSIMTIIQTTEQL